VGFAWVELRPCGTSSVCGAFTESFDWSFSSRRRQSRGGRLNSRTFASSPSAELHRRAGTHPRRLAAARVGLNLFRDTSRPRRASSVGAHHRVGRRGGSGALWE
jgi:hypothetical protein